MHIIQYFLIHSAEWKFSRKKTFEQDVIKKNLNKIFNCSIFFPILKIPTEGKIWLVGWLVNSLFYFTAYQHVLGHLMPI